MKRSESIVVLQHYVRRSKEANRLASFFPDAIARQLDAAPPKESPVADLSLSALFERIHPDWYIPYLDTLPAKDRLFYLSALHQDTTYSLSPPLTHMFLSNLLRAVFPKAPLPLSFVAEEKLAPLLALRYDDWMKLFRFLGLFDLVPEQRLVIKGSTLKQLQELLSPEEHRFMQEIRQLRSHVQLHPMGLQNWDGNQEKMRKSIFDRGVYRAYLVLSLSSPHFLWYIEHTLTPELAKKLLQTRTFLKDTKILGILTEQLLTTQDTLCTPSP